MANNVKNKISNTQKFCQEIFTQFRLQVTEQSNFNSMFIWTRTTLLHT